VDDVAYVAGLRGQRLWQVPLGDAKGAVARFTEEYGRLRTVVQAPSGRAVGVDVEPRRPPARRDRPRTTTRSWS
jgi:hypothetical protein